jgi:hypothetical protein
MQTHNDFVRDLTNYLKNSATARDKKDSNTSADGSELSSALAAFNLSSMNIQY